MKIRGYVEDEIYVVELKGDLDKGRFSEIKPCVLNIVKDDRKKIVLDMQSVKDVDESWYDFLVKLNRVMAAYGRKLVLSGCPGHLYDIEKAKKVLATYAVFPSLDEGKKHFKPRNGVVAHSGPIKEGKSGSGTTESKPKEKK